MRILSKKEWDKRGSESNKNIFSVSFLEKENESRQDKKDSPPGNIIPENVISRTVSHSLHAISARLPHPHVALGSFARAFRDYIHYSVYSGFNGLVFGSYNKSIQSYLQRRRYTEDEGNTSTIDFSLPIFSYIIQIESTDEKLDLPWRSTTWMPALSRVVYPSFYACDDFELKVIFRRLKGTVNSTIYCSSEAELLDIQMHFLDGFRGLNVYNQIDITAMTILPSAILFTDVEGRRISRALTSEHITKSFIPSVNATHYFISSNISAIINMQSLSQGSNYYGASALPDFNLSGTFNFEIDIPQFILCLAKQEYSGIEIGMDVMFKYENEKAVSMIRYITGDPLDSSHDDGEILDFVNGSIIDKVAYTVPQDDVLRIPISSLFTNRKIQWSVENRDIIIMVIYPGGVIRMPLDSEVASYDKNGDIVLNAITQDDNSKYQVDLFNPEDVLEIYVFKLRPDIDK